MELRHLKYFLAVANELHFGRAASKLCIEPSPLSRAIKELEEELGVCLFIRNSRKTKLTEDGESLLRSVNQIFKILEETKRNFTSHHTYFPKKLKIAVSDDINIYRFSEIVRFYREREPQFDVQVIQTTYEEQVNGIFNREYDFGFCKNDKVVKDGLLLKKMWEEKLIALLPSHHPMLRYQEVAIRSILKYPLIILDPELYSGYYKQIKDISNAEGVQLKVASYAKSYEMVLALVSAGYGISLIAADKFKHFRTDTVLSRQIQAFNRGALLKTYLICLSEIMKSPHLDKLIKTFAK